MAKFTEKEAKQLLMDSIDSVLKDKTLFLNNPDKAFSRIRKISFRDAMLFPVVTANNDTNTELIEFFGKENVPSLPATIYRRNQIKSTAYEEVFKRFTAAIPRYRKLLNFRVIVCDGTRLNTPYHPSDTDSFVPNTDGRRGYNQYHLNTLYDLLNDLYVDAVIQPYKSMNEKRAFCDMIDRYPNKEPTLFIADRGYASFNVLAHLIKNNFYFVIRVTSLLGKKLFSDNHIDTYADSFDLEDEIHVGRSRSKSAGSLKNYHRIKSTSTYDYISHASPKVDCFRLRLLKFPIGQNNFEYIVTNLPCGTYSLENIKEIYRIRWGIETSFRFLKYADGVTHIRSLKPEFIRQEIYAKLTGYNFCTAVSAKVSTQKEKPKKHEYKINKTNHIKMCLLFLKGLIPDISGLEKMVPTRDNRSFERNLRRQHADTTQYK